MIFFSTLLLAMFITIVLIPLFKGLAVRLRIVDIPNPRKIHTRPMPRIGGPAMALGALIPIICWSSMDGYVQSILIGSGIVVLFGLFDDIKDLNYRAKFISQFAAALFVVFYGGIKLKWPDMPLPGGMIFANIFCTALTLFFIVGVTNAINFSDGLDGLAGGVSILTFIGIGYLAYLSDNTVITLISAAVIGAIFGFLRFNTYPAVIFMGDAGSQVLGFLAAVLSVSLVQSNPPYCVALPLLLVGFPVLDTLTVMTERIAEKSSPFTADTRHFHHRLIRLGFYHTEAVLFIYVFQALIITAAVLFRFYSEWFMTALYLLFSGTVLGWFLVAEKTGKRIVRSNFFDNTIKGNLKILKEKKLLVKVSFKIIYIGIPLLLLITSFIPVNIPVYFTLFAFILALIILLTLIFKKDRLTNVLRFCIYLFVPYLIFISRTDIALWLNGRMEAVYNLSFGVLVFFVIATLKFTTRKKGFKSTPMDFIILFIALIVPNLPVIHSGSEHMGLLAAKAIVFLFSYEVIIGELRGEVDKLGMAAAAAFMVVFIKGVI